MQASVPPWPSQVINARPVATECSMPGASSAQSNWDVDLGVIYTYEDQFMPRLLATLAASGQGIRSRLILVDNVSERGAEVWRPHFPEVMVLKNTSRLGYAENLNRVLAASTARYALLLNTEIGRASCRERG